MFHFFHSYYPGCDVWKGFIRRGLIDDSSGVKFNQFAGTPPQLRFNETAGEGSEVWELVREADRPFYVDRLLGGAPYFPYVFSPRLRRLYEELLGDRFLGFQIHEWASNYTQDLTRIRSALREEEQSHPDGATIESAIRREHPLSYGVPCLESQSAGEFGERPFPTSAAETILELRRFYQKWHRETGGRLLPADSFLIGPRLELDCGSRSLMPEVGWQIQHTRVQLALVRGCAASAGADWGVYYECFGGEPFGVCYYKRDAVFEWGKPDDTHTPYQKNGERMGSSRALQRRILRYAYLSGAHFISEEWGLVNTFYDWRDFELTPYGQVKKEFLAFTRSLPDPGVPFTPVALVLPRSLPFFDLGWLRGNTGEYLSFPVGAEQAGLQANIAAILLRLFGDGKNRPGNEAHAMTNSGFGDLFDLVYEDAPDLFSRYRYAVDLTGGSAFASAHPDERARILAAASPDDLEQELRQVCRELCPVEVQGNVHWLLNRRGNGWLLALFHNDGVLRTVERGEILLPEGASTVRLALPPGWSPRPLEGERRMTREDDGSFRLTLPAGGHAIFLLDGAEAGV